MDQFDYKSLGWFSIGMAIGLGIGALVVDYLYTRPLDKDREDEILIREPEKSESKDEEKSEETDSDFLSIQPKSSIGEMEQYQRMIMKYNGYYDDNIAEEDQGAYDKRPNAIDEGYFAKTDHPLDDDEENTGARVISREDYDQPSPAFDKVGLTYYAADDTLADDNDMIVNNMEDILGEEGASVINDNTPSTMPRTFYVRNYDMSADYEVVVDDGAYEEIVLGIIPEEDGRPGPKKMRDYD